MKKVSRIIVLCLLIIIILSTIILQNKKEEKVLANKNKNKTNFISMMIEQSDGSYKENNNLNLEETGYVFNQEKSGCENGGTIVWDNEKEKVEASLLTSDKCYAYFDRGGGLKIIDSKPHNLNANQAGMYRYQGSKTEVNNNYLCFGTSNKDECLVNQDKYMYRIIGITTDGLIKVIKNASIGDYAWHNDNQSNAPWPNSDLYKKLNGLVNDSIFLNSSNVNENWEKYIANYNWPYGYRPGFTVENINDILNLEAGLSETYFADKVANDLKGTEGITCTNIKSGINKDQETCYKLIHEFWQKINSKISLLSFLDVYFAVQKDGYNCRYNRTETELEPCTNSYLTLESERLIINGGYSTNTDEYGSWQILKNGAPSWVNSYSSKAPVRPVFYIKANVMLKGNGTTNEPYLIK